MISDCGENYLNKTIDFPVICNDILEQRGEANSMYRIGEFSRMCNTTSKTLRFYDSAGVLKPDYIDASTGYRYYYKSKLIAYQRITTLKNIGFTLEEIRDRFMDASNEEIIALLNKKESDLLTAYHNCSNMKREYERSINMCKESLKLNVQLENPDGNKISLKNGSQTVSLSIEDSDILKCMQMLNNLLNGDNVVTVGFQDLVSIISQNSQAFLNILQCKDSNIDMMKQPDCIKSCVVYIQLSANKTLENVKQFLDPIMSKLPENTPIVWGAAVDKNLNDEFLVSVLSCT